MLLSLRQDGMIDDEAKMELQKGIKGLQKDSLAMLTN
jgi:hypothetical protein